MSPLAGWRSDCAALARRVSATPQSPVVAAAVLALLALQLRIRDNGPGPSPAGSEQSEEYIT